MSNSIHSTSADAFSESDLKYQIPLNTNNIPIIVWDFETLGIIAVNDKAVDTYGYPREEFITLNVRQIGPPEDLVLMEAATGRQEAFSNQHRSISWHKKKSGELLYMQVNAYSKTVDNRNVIIAHIFDVTGHAEAKDRFSGSEEQYRLLFNKGPLPVLIYELVSFTILDVNEAAIKHYGYSREEFLGMTIHDYRPREEIVKITNLLRDLPQNESIYDLGLNNHLKKDGTLVEVEVSGYRINYKGLDCMQVVINDVTEKQRALRQLKEDEKKLIGRREELALIYNNIKDSIFVINVEDGPRFKFVSVNHSFMDTTGLSEAGILYKYIDDVIPEPSLSLATAYYMQAITAKTKISWEETTAYPTGVKTGIVSITPIFGDDGICLQLIGSVFNITERKKEEKRLKLLESVITNAKDSIMITEAEPFEEPGPRIIFVNDAFTKMTGFTSEEVIGKTPRILQGPKSDKEGLRRLGEDLRKWKPGEVTTINYKKNGDEFWINFSLTPVADENGWFTHWIAIERDVTEQIAAARQLQASYDERNEVLESIGDGFFAIDHNWVVTYWNNSAERILKKPKADIVGKDLRNVFPVVPGRIAYDYYEKAFAEQTVQTFNVCTEELGSWFEVVVYPSKRGLSVYFKDKRQAYLYKNDRRTKYQTERNCLDTIALNKGTYR